MFCWARELLQEREQQGNFIDRPLKVQDSKVSLA
jgi:hypothetical protein